MGVWVMNQIPLTADRKQMGVVELFIVRRRGTEPGARWRIIGRAPTGVAAVKMIGGKGADWWISKRVESPDAAADPSEEPEDSE